MATSSKYYRPEWTAGRYNLEHNVAIYYNLIEGISYFFEDDSATVIGYIISLPRNSSFNIDDISNATSLAKEELIPFLEELVQRNIITKSSILHRDIESYRSRMSRWKRNNIYNPEKATKEKLPFAVTSAEMAYSEKVGGIIGVMFELTYTCSEKCIHCYNIGATRNDEEKNHRNLLDEMSIEDYKSAIDQLYDLGLIKVTLSGGDPFSKPCVWEIIDYLYFRGIVFDIYTNGQRLIGNVAKLADYYPRLVGISLYSGEPSVHDSITRIQGSFDKSIKVIKELSDKAVPLNIKCCVMQPNIKTYRQINEIAKRYGAYPQYELSVTDSIEGDKCVSRYLRLKPEQYEIILRDDCTPLYVGPEAPNYGGQPRNMSKNVCGAGINTICISPNGNLIPCCSFHMIIGNIKKQPISVLLKSETLQQWKNASLKDYEECGRHKYCDY